MKKIYLSAQKKRNISSNSCGLFVGFIVLMTVLISSCSDSSKEKSRFMKAYKEILIARETTQDTIRANKEVQKIFKKYNYTEKSFREKYFEMASNREEFINMIDSVRKIVTKEIGDKPYKEELAEMRPSDTASIKKDSIVKGKMVKPRKRPEPSK